MAFVITEGCVDVKDKACLEDCPVECIYEGNRMTYINPDECIDCGACEPLCPQKAIFLDVELPGPLTRFIQINAEFAASEGASGGSPSVDVTDRDHPDVIAFEHA
jgi:ferredoxin